MHWRTLNDHVAFPGGDPYTHLRTGEKLPKGFATASDGNYRPILVSLSDNDPEAFQEHYGLRVPAFYTNPSPSLQSRCLSHCTALASQDGMEALKTGPFRARIIVLPPIADASLPPDMGSAASGTNSRMLDIPPNPQKVVMGVIDDGIAFAHERFRLNAFETRIASFWVQDAPFRDNNKDDLLAHANPVPYGAEISSTTINNWWAEGADFRIEDALYHHAAKRLGKNWLQSISRRAAHGTHVMDLACGYDLSDRHQALREQRPIVCVQLPQATTVDTSGENLDTYLLDAIRYIVDRADAIAEADGTAPLPVVINCSYGNVAGSHDGTSGLELAIDELIRHRREAAQTEVVLPSGNSHLGRLHAKFALSPHKTSEQAGGDSFNSCKQELRWQVHPDDRTPTFMEIWLEEGLNPEKHEVQLTITAPGGTDSSRISSAESDAGAALLNDQGNVLCEARYRSIDTSTNADEATKRGMFLIAIQPTKASVPSDPGVSIPSAPAGTWIIKLDDTGPAGSVVNIEAWIQRDDTSMGSARHGRQSYYNEPCYHVFNPITGVLVEEDSDQPPCHVLRDGSMNAIATGSETVVVGGYRSKEGRPAPYSAGGPLAAACRSGPDALAVSDRSHVLPGVLAAGTRSGSVVAMNGTSAAAPQVARLIANEIADAARRNEQPANGRRLVKKIAEEHETELAEQRQGHVSPRSTCERGGAGRIIRFGRDTMRGMSTREV